MATAPTPWTWELRRTISLRQALPPSGLGTYWCRPTCVEQHGMLYMRNCCSCIDVWVVRVQVFVDGQLVGVTDRDHTAKVWQAQN